MTVFVPAGQGTLGPSENHWKRESLLRVVAVVRIVVCVVVVVVISVVIHVIDEFRHKVSSLDPCRDDLSRKIGGVFGRGDMARKTLAHRDGLTGVMVTDFVRFFL